MEADEIHKLIGELTKKKSVSINNKVYSVKKIKKHDINDDNDWITEFEISDGKELHKLEFIFNEDTDYVFTGLFFDNKQISTQKIK